MVDEELLKLSRLQQKYADLIGELQKILERMNKNDGRADDADRTHLIKTEKKMKQVSKQMKELGEKILNRKKQ